MIEKEFFKSNKGAEVKQIVRIQSKVLWRIFQVEM
jgi:hypothetical protein